QRERRLISVDPLEFIARDMTVYGPSSSAQRYPNSPIVSSSLQEPGDFESQWKFTGDWMVRDGVMTAVGSGAVNLALELKHGATVEVWVRGLLRTLSGTFGIVLTDYYSHRTAILVNMRTRQLEIRDDAGMITCSLPM